MYKKIPGFTILELVAVVSIVAILALIVLPNYKWVLVRSDLADVMPFIDSVVQTSNDYYVANGYYPNAQQLGFANTTGGTTISSADAQAINEMFAEVYIPGDTTAATATCNPIGSLWIYLNGEAFPNGTIAGGPTYSSGSNTDGIFVQFGPALNGGGYLIGCETLLAVDGFLGANGHYSYITCPDGYSIATSSPGGGYQLPEVCPGTALP